MGKEDFGFGGGTDDVTNNPNLEDKTDLDTGKVGNGVGENIDGTNGTNNNEPPTNPDTTGETNGNAAEETNEYEAGTVIEIDGSNYTIDEQGNLVDDKGTIFKAKEEVSDYLKTFEVQNPEEEPSINVADIQQLVGVSVTDESGKVVEFENTPQGVASYVNSVLEVKQNEFAQAGINKLFEDYPILNDFLAYYVANGNNYEGFGQLKDRSGITIDEQNVAQQEAIVREAFKEFGRKGSVDKYITYLKDSGQLLDVAKDELAALQQADAEVRQRNSQEAIRRQQAYEEEVNNYWKGVKAAIDKREIAGYKIPETVIINRGGKQISVTPNDFFSYIYDQDNEGITRYQRELANETPEQRRDEEMLKAWLKYTGKSYDSLVEMAVAANEVKKLKLVAAKNKTSKATIKITKPSSKGGSVAANETYGY
jgi:hypothetical protein